MTELRQKALAFAVSHYLETYPQNISFEDICYLVRESKWDETLNAWEPYKGCGGDWIADQIEIMASLLEVTFG
jgi:hypothetical protein